MTHCQTARGALVRCCLKDQPIDAIFLKPRDTIAIGLRKDTLYFRLASGCTVICRYMPDGRRQICDIVGPGRSFGFSLHDAHACVAEALTYSNVESRSSCRTRTPGSSQ